MEMMLVSVQVKYGGILYECENMGYGWVCGQCAAHLFKAIPRKGSKCPLCAAKVANKKFVVDDRPAPPF